MPSRVRLFLLNFGREAVAIAAIQAVNFLVPLAALPFLSRSLGLTAFGIYSTALVLALYVAAVSDYTFNINGPLRLSRESSLPPSERSLLYVSVVVRIGLAAICLPAVAALLAWAAQATVGVIVAACANILANAATPRWALYARGQLRFFLVATAAARGLWLAGSIWAVARPDDLALLLTWTAICQFALAIACWQVVRPANRQSAGDIGVAARRLLKEDLGLFLSSTATALVRDGAPFVLSVLQGPATMSLYAVSDRVRVAAIGLSAPFTQSLFLRLARANAHERIDDHLRAAGNIAVLVPVILGCLVLAIFADPLVNLLAGREYGLASSVLRILLMAPPLVCFNAIVGTNTLLAEGEGSSYSRAQLLAAAVSTPLIIALVYTFGIWGAAVATVGQEVVLAAIMLWHLKKANLLWRAFYPGGTNEKVI